MIHASLVNGQEVHYDRYQIIQDGTNPAQVLFYTEVAGLVAGHRAEDIHLLDKSDPTSALPSEALGARRSTP